jgi:hypothetical protein
VKLERTSSASGSESFGEKWNRLAKDKSRTAAWRPVVIGLVVLAALIAIVWKFVTSGEARPEAAEAPREIRQVPVENLSPAGRVPRSEIGRSVPIRFRWRKLDSASYYFVRVFGPGGAPLDSSQVTSPPYEPSEAKRELFLASGEYSWEVSAYTADARVLGKSERVTFTIE